MRLGLSRKGDHSIRALIRVGRGHDAGARVKARVIADDTGIPRKTLAGVLADLVGRGLLEGRAGPQGGYRLSRPPDETRVLDIIEAVEGPLDANACPFDGRSCDDGVTCPLHTTWTQTITAMRERLAEATLADMLTDDDALFAHAAVSPD